MWSADYAAEYSGDIPLWRGNGYDVGGAVRGGTREHEKAIRLQSWRRIADTSFFSRWLLGALGGLGRSVVLLGRKLTRARRLHRDVREPDRLRVELRDLDHLRRLVDGDLRAVGQLADALAVLVEAELEDVHLVRRTERGVFRELAD